MTDDATNLIGLPSSTITELQRLKPERIVVVGGTGVVSAAVLTALHAYAGAVERVSGADRYATAAALSKKAFPTGAPVAYVASGEDFPDGIAAGAVVAGGESVVSSQAYEGVLGVGRP